MRYSGPAGVSVPGDSPRETTRAQAHIVLFPLLVVGTQHRPRVTKGTPLMVGAIRPSTGPSTRKQMLPPETQRCPQARSEFRHGFCAADATCPTGSEGLSVLGLRGAESIPSCWKLVLLPVSLRPHTLAGEELPPLGGGRSTAWTGAAAGQAGPGSATANVRAWDGRPVVSAPQGADASRKHGSRVWFVLRGPRWGVSTAIAHDMLSSPSSSPSGDPLLASVASTCGSGSRVAAGGVMCFRGFGHLTCRSAGPRRQDADSHGRGSGAEQSVVKAKRSGLVSPCVRVSLAAWQ